MHARKALLKRLATINDWEAASRAFFGGESWLESRNTVYRFRDGVCFDVATRDPRKSARARALIGMRLVGWLAAKGSLLSDEWQAGASAVLWRPGRADAEEAVAMTSATHSFARGRSSAHLQALHDHVPPVDSQTFRRDGGEAKRPGGRPSLPSSSYRSG